MTSTRSQRPGLLGIDLGTSSVKAIVTDLDGTLLGQAAADYPVNNPHPGWAETDPADWLAATIAAVRQAVARAGADVRAVGLSGQMHGLVAAAADGTPVRPAMLWSDSRAAAQVALYRDLPDPVRARLANPLTPGMAGPMLAWLANHETDVYKTARWALQPKDWLRAQLTGRYATEPSDASATLLYDLTADAWDSQVIDALDLDPAMLPEVLASAGQHGGDLTGSAAGLLGLRAGTPVAAGAADTAAAALGSGLVESDTAQLTIGTGAQVITPVAALPRPATAAPVTHLYRAATDRGWYRMAAVLNAGLTLGWVRQVLAGSWPELYAAAAAEPSADDPFFLPHLNGERTPYMDPDLRGAWTGLSPRHGRLDLLRAALEGVAFAICDAVDCVVVADVSTDHLRLAGGGSTDPAWRQLLADVLGRELRAVDVPAASGRGAALLGARGAGLMDEQTLLARLPPVTDVVARPRHDRVSFYAERHRSFTRKVAALRGPDRRTPATNQPTHRPVTSGPTATGRRPSPAPAASTGVANQPVPLRTANT